MRWLLQHDKTSFYCVEAFVYPETRFARKMFLFKDRTLQEPTREFYELEEEYFLHEKVLY